MKLNTPQSSAQYLICLWICIIAILSACNKDSEQTLPERVVSYSPVSSYSANAIENTLSLQMLVYPELSAFADHIVTGITVYRVNYKTTFKDSVITASGLMCIPTTSGSYPVISFQNGTNTLNANAPSVNPFNSNFLLIEFLASNGYVVLIPDYIGFGASSDILHPYYHRASTNNAVTDLIRAFTELSESGAIPVSPNDSLFLMGYSQGGGATISVLAEIESSGSPDMEVIAVSAGAGAYNLMDFSTYLFSLETFPSPFYLPYFVYSQMVYGSISAPLSRFFNEPYAGRIPGLFDGMHGGSAINDELSENISEMFTTGILTEFETGDQFAELREVLEQNSISAWNTGASIHLYHGNLDDNVPAQQSLNLYNGFIDAGVEPGQINHFVMEGRNHDSGVMPWGVLTIEWFNSLKNF
jgi:pimeloyl-ACP methyl ester carboxylesterase